MVFDKKEYNIRYYKKNKEKLKRVAIQWLKDNPNRKKASDDRYIKKQTCTILKNHHESTKGDPEHLSTDFIKEQMRKLSGNDIDCNVRDD